MRAISGYVGSIVGFDVDRGISHGPPIMGSYLVKGI